MLVFFWTGVSVIKKTISVQINTKSGHPNGTCTEVDGASERNRTKTLPAPTQAAKS